jgi:hypothetical protein
MQFVAKIDSPWGIITTQILTGDAWRVVESQEQIATLGLVSNLSEQYLLEQMLDGSKNKVSDEIDKLDYLLFTPFRYPPLKWGSRFGIESKRGIFYGSKKLETALAEVAYYRLLFWDGMSKAPATSILTQHTGFQADYKMKTGVDMTKSPFDSNEYSKQLLAKTDYSFTQTVGSFLRENDVDGLCFYSARALDASLNTALFEPATLFNKKPFNKKEIVCELNQNTVSFTTSHGNLSNYYQFSREALF